MASRVRPLRSATAVPTARVGLARWADRLLVLAPPLLTLVVLLSYWNRFVGLTADGWFLAYAERLLDGRIPYRDFYMYGPPGHLFIEAAVVKVFGEKLIAIRALGLVERPLMAALAYLWLARLFPRRAALAGALVAGVVQLGDIADIVTYYHQESTLFGMAAGLSASLAVSAPSTRRLAMLSFSAGMLAGCTLLVKQTTGAGVTVALLVVLPLVVWRLHGTARGAVALLCYVAGWPAVVGPVLAWLAGHGALEPFVRQVFIEGPASKGPLLIVLARPLTQTLQRPELTIYAGAALLVLLAAWRSRLLRRRRPEAETTAGVSTAVSRITLAAAAAALIGLALGWAAVIPSYLLRVPLLISLYLAIWSVTALGATWGLRLLRDGQRRDGERAILGATAFSIVYMLSLSWTAFEPMAMPALAVTVAFLFDRIDSATGPKTKLMWHGLGCLLIACTVALKLSTPFFWGAWREGAVRTATVPAATRGLQGIRMQPQSAAAINTITTAVLENSGPGDSVFTFPHLPLVYALTERWPDTFALVHWFDVVTDTVATADAARLAAAPPKVIVELVLPEKEWRDSEKDFRGGGRSGQRVLSETIARLTTDGYRLASETIAPGRNTPVRIWVRVETAPAQ